MYDESNRAARSSETSQYGGLSGTRARVLNALGRLAYIPTPLQSDYLPHMIRAEGELLIK
jgi:hypothetical protein